VAAAGDAILSVKGLTKEHGCGPARVQALRGIDLEVSPGEFVAVMGASGSGKSTLLHLIAGLDRPSGGSIRLGGIDLACLEDDQRTLLRRQRIGLIFQSFHLLDMLTAEENVALPLAIAGRPGAEARRRASQALDLVGLGPRGRHRPHELSGGEQQRVAIARALVTGPLLLLADEPTGNLDSVQGSKIIALLRGLADEHRQTLLMVTHDASHASLADRIVTLQDGLVVKECGARAGRGGSPTLPMPREAA
jgi:putative ABC transport system ATP-binding protein